MNKVVMLVVLSAALLTAGLYSLPRVVVQNADKQLSSRDTQTSGAGSATAATGSNEMGAAGASVHEQPLSAEQNQQLAKLRNGFLTATDPDKKEAAAGKLIARFHELTRYDSAAYYAEALAMAIPSEQNQLRAGDAYFEAYTFAVDDKKTALLGQKTRGFYEQVLAKNPDLLAAKANMAMTYVNTDSPMKGIALLREVIQQDPTNELALFNLGLLSMRSNQYERAIERFRQILVSNPSSRKAKFYLGVSLAEAGHKDEARQVLADVKKQEKDPQILAAVREYEERLGK